jgi:hypothetical protein
MKSAGKDLVVAVRRVSYENCPTLHEIARRNPLTHPQL